MTFREFLTILQARSSLAVRVFLGIVIATVLVLIVMPRKYTGTAAVVVDSSADPVAGAATADLLSATYLATQVDIASSDPVAQRAVKLLKFDQLPAFQEKWRRKTGGRGDIVAWIADDLSNAVDITPSRESNVINISAKWGDGKVAADIANAFMQAYIDTTIDLKVAPAKEYATWFDERSRELRDNLLTSQKRLSDYQAKAGITAADEHYDVENQRLTDISTQLTTVQAQLQDSQSRLASIQQSGETAPDVLQSALIAGLKTNLAVAEAKLKNLAVTVGDNHPDYTSEQAEIASLRGRIAEEEQRIVGSLRDSVQINTQKVTDLSAALEAQKKKVLSMGRERDQFTVLQSDVTSAQRDLDDTSQKLTQSSLESQIQHTNVIPLAHAIEPINPSSPKFLLTFAAGIFLGLVFGVSTAVVAELADPIVRRNDEVVRLLSVPLLAEIGPPATARRRLALPFFRSSEGQAT